MRRFMLLAIGTVALLVPQPTDAQKVPIGPQFQVNTYTTGDQGGVAPYVGCAYTGGRGQAVGSDAAGNFVVVWSDGSGFYGYGPGQDGSYRGIFAQRYDASGTPVASEFRVNSYTTGDQRYPRLAVGTGGDFVVVWNGQDSYYDGYPGTFYDNVHGQRYDSSGVPQGGEFEVAIGDPDTPYENPRYPGVALDGNGNFIVVWDTGFDNPIYGRRYDSTGAPVSGQFQVNTGTLCNYDENPDVIADANDGFVVVWQGRCAGYWGIAGRRYDSTGSPQGDPFSINTPAWSYWALFPRAAPDASGGFVVAWATDAVDDYGYPLNDHTDVAVRRFDSGGAAIGSEFRVNTTTAGNQRCVDVASGGDGSFVVTWTQHYYPATSEGFGQQFDSSGTPLGAEFLLNTDTGSDNVAHSSSVAADASGNFVVVWTDYASGGAQGRDGDGLGVFGQRFGDPGSFACTSAPRTDCRQQTNRRRGVFRFRAPGIPRRNSLAWNVPTLQATTFADFGDPFTDTDYMLCVYDDSTDDQPILAASMPADGICNVVPCWTELAPPGKTIRYLDTLGTPDGIKIMRLRAGDEGRVRVGARGRGENVPLPVDPLTPPVTVQLQASNGLCFTARYHDRIRKNEPGKFIARPGSPSAAFVDGGPAGLLD